MKKESIIKEQLFDIKVVDQLPEGEYAEPSILNIDFYKSRTGYCLMVRVPDFPKGLELDVLRKKYPKLPNLSEISSVTFVNIEVEIGSEMMMFFEEKFYKENQVAVFLNDEVNLFKDAIYVYEQYQGKVVTRQKITCGNH